MQVKHQYGYHNLLVGRVYACCKSPSGKAGMAGLTFQASLQKLSGKSGEVLFLETILCEMTAVNMRLVPPCFLQRLFLHTLYFDEYAGHLGSLMCQHIQKFMKPPAGSHSFSQNILQKCFFLYSVLGELSEGKISPLHLPLKWRFLSKIKPRAWYISQRLCIPSALHIPAFHDLPPVTTSGAVHVSINTGFLFLHSSALFVRYYHNVFPFW